MFPTLGASYMFPTLGASYISPRLAQVTCFPRLALFKVFCHDVWWLPSNLSVYCDWIHYSQKVLHCLLSIICILFFIFSWVDICENTIFIRQQQAQKITLLWKHKSKTYLIFTPWRRCCFAFQQPKWVKEKKQHYITFFYISGLQQEHRDMSAGKQVVCPKTLYVVISSSTSQAKVLTADLRTPKSKEVLRDDSQRKKGSK